MSPEWIDPKSAIPLSKGAHEPAALLASQTVVEPQVALALNEGRMEDALFWLAVELALFGEGGESDDRFAVLRGEGA